MLLQSAAGRGEQISVGGVEMPEIGAEGLLAVPVTRLYDQGNNMRYADVVFPRIASSYVALNPADGEGMGEELQSLSDQKLQEISIERRDIEAIASQFVEMIDLPDVINLNEVLEEAGNEQQFQDVVTGIQVFKRMLNIVPTIVFTLILIGFCLLGRIQGGLTWFGAGIMTSGLLFLGALYAFKSVLFEAVGSGIGRISQGIAIEHASIVSLVNYTVGRMSPMPIIFIILGIASIAAAFVIKHKQGKQEIYGTNADM